MSIAPAPAEIFDRAVAEGRRRLDQSLLELTATSFIAGFTIVVATAGNLVGGLGLVTFTHVAQARGARESN